MIELTDTTASAIASAFCGNSGGSPRSTSRINRS